MIQTNAVVKQSKALDAAVRALHTAHKDTSGADSNALAIAARQVSRVADEVELTALETGDLGQRDELLNAVVSARKAVSTARQTARERALAASRNALFKHPSHESLSKHTTDQRSSTEPSSLKKSSTQSKDTQTEASKLINDINETLRRSMAVVSDEVVRSQATGAVFDESTRRLRMTRDQHKEMSGGIQQGTKTLRRLHLSEIFANGIVAFSFAFFFVVAAYVVLNRRVL